MEAYLDNSATTRALPEVVDIMRQTMLEDYGNPSSMHMKGVDAEKYIKYSAEVIAGSLKCKSDNILFTSGGTESDNMAIIGAAMAKRRSGKHIITTKIEHPAVLRTCEYLKDEGFEITYLDVNHNGIIDKEQLSTEIRTDTTLVSIMHTNNEIGSLQPIEEAADIIHKKNPDTLFHVDAIQGYGKCPIYPKRMGIDLMSVSAHKIHGPKGVGFLYSGDRVRLLPLIHGGGQQGGLRSGTENVPGIAGLGKAVEIGFKTMEEDREKMNRLRANMVGRLTNIDGITVNGYNDGNSAPHIVSVSISDVRAEVILHALEDKGVYVSAGSACSSNKPAVSATLKAIGLKDSLLGSTIRLSLSPYTTAEETDYAIDCMEELIPRLRRYTRK